MNKNDFEAFIREQLVECLDLLDKKSREYAEVDNRLSAFDIDWLIDAPAPELTLWGMLVKHLNSIYTMILKTSKGQDKFTFKEWQEKCFDILNYILLLLGIEYSHNVPRS